MARTCANLKARSKFGFRIPSASANSDIWINTYALSEGKPQAYERIDLERMRYVEELNLHSRSYNILIVLAIINVSAYESYSPG